MKNLDVVRQEGTRIVWCIPKDVIINGRRLTEDEVLDALEAGRHGTLAHLASPAPYRLLATSD